MNLTNREIMCIHSVFNQNGYVLNFSDYTFSKFTTDSIGEDIQLKYQLSKGKSLDSYFSDSSVKIENKMKLLKDLLDYKKDYDENQYDILGLKPAIDPGVSAILKANLKKCYSILDEHSGITLSTDVETINEKGLKELIEESEKYLKLDKKVAVEKIWDALERLKTYFLSDAVNKKQSVELLVKKISHDETNYIELFNEEFLKLTEIGNKYRIRHHEIDKIEINDEKYYYYFYNRCMALINLAIKYIS